MHESVLDHSEYHSFALYNLIPANEITVYVPTNTWRRHFRVSQEPQNRAALHYMTNI